MVEWFRTLPKAIFVTLVLTAGILFIVLSDPPLTVCDTQIKAYDEKTKDYLKVDTIKRPNRQESRYTRLVNTCRATNSPGGCYELFLSLKQLVKDIYLVSPECLSGISKHAETNTALWQSLDLMATLAWGTKPPELVSLKTSWFDPSDLNLFCELRRVSSAIHGDLAWNQFVEVYFEKLPGVKSLDRAEAWQRMLFSVNCSSYL